MKFLKTIAWTIWLIGWVEIIVVNIYFYRVYPKEFAQKVEQECGQLSAEMQDYADAYNKTADQLNECNKQFVIKSEEANKDINSTPWDPNDNPSPNDPNKLGEHGDDEAIK